MRRPPLPTEGARADLRALRVLAPYLWPRDEPEMRMRVAAALGLLALLAYGAAHGAGWLPARPAVVGFVVAFLLPLVSGAASHLLPVWLRPGVQGAWHKALRARLCRWGGLRGLLLLLLGLAIAAN